MIPDVLIVGAGPAGAALGGLLSRSGVRVLILDRAMFPRPKPCGECLNPGAVALLQRLGVWEAVAGLQPLPLKGWRVQGRDLDFPGALRAMAVDRGRLDHALLNWAAAQGAAVEEGVKVTDLLRGPGNGRVAGAIAVGGRAFPAGLTVGADGLHSVVLRRLGLRGPARAAPRVALTAHWDGVTGLTDRGELHVRGSAVCGIAPLGRGEANVVLVLPASGARGAAQAQALRAWPGLRERFAQARLTSAPQATGPFDQPVRTAAAPGALLIGDAAGYFDPFTGQGIYRALRSAEMAAAAILHGDRYDPVGEFAPAVRRQRWLDGLVRRPAALSAGLWCLARFPAAGAHFLGRLGDAPRP